MIDPVSTDHELRIKVASKRMEVKTNEGAYYI